ncbi:9629_t:CDS:10 [Diversispora eburnea]|uniref:9629_t:CDS:1 n=1 Tax=Diversispora eburnea TaxID=1213867 RepID=A0A9N8ZK48_9GLOM|nr:9629_t:CDS:10 [Diversispora eburnea]
MLKRQIRIINIRANRDKPGLKPQHVCGLQLLSDIFQSELQGDKIGSKEILFYPNHEIKEELKTFIADTKTAGSISLLIQISLPPLLFSASPPKSYLALPPRARKVILKGGTAVFRPIVLREFDINFDVNITRRGYWPQGGGDVMLRVDPIVGRALNPLKIIDRGTFISIKGRVNLVNMAKQVADKMISGAIQTISSAMLTEINKIKPKIEVNIEKNVIKGSDILLWAETSTGCIISGHAISKKKDVGKLAANELLNNIRHGGCVDEYLQDQLIIFMSLAEGKSQLVTGPITMHTITAIHFVEKMSGIKFQISKFSSESQQYLPIEKLDYISIISIKY